MKCEKCGKNIPEQINYCPTCKINEIRSVNHEITPAESKLIIDNSVVQPFQNTATESLNSSMKKKDRSYLFVLGMVIIVMALAFIFEENKKEIETEAIIVTTIGLTIQFSIIVAIFKWLARKQKKANQEKLKNYSGILIINWVLVGGLAMGFGMANDSGSMSITGTIFQQIGFFSLILYFIIPCQAEKLANEKNELAKARLLLWLPYIISILCFFGMVTYA